MPRRLPTRGRPSWNQFLVEVKRCRLCRGYSKVKAVPDAKAWTGCDPPDPSELPRGKGGRRVLFLSEAPPGGSETFFWRDQRDRLRVFLFDALRDAGFSIGQGDDGLTDFGSLGFYLLPSFSYPCGIRRYGTIRNTKPSREMIQHSARVHLSMAIRVIDPTEVVLLGESAVTAGMALGLKSYPTYWPTNRTGHWDDVVAAIKKALL